MENSEEIKIHSYIRAAVKTGRIAQSYIFYGENRLLLDTSVDYFAQYLNCRSMLIKPCYECPECLAISKGQSSDYVSYGSNEGISAEELRNILESVSKKKFSAEYRVVVIRGLEKASAGSADILLKTLEESPEKTVFIILTPVLRALPSTIRSRSVKLAAYDESETRIFQEEEKEILERILNSENIIELDSEKRDELKKQALCVYKLIASSVLNILGAEDCTEETVARFSQSRDLGSLLVASDSLGEYIATLDNINPSLAKELISNVV